MLCIIRLFLCALYLIFTFKLSFGFVVLDPSGFTDFFFFFLDFVSAQLFGLILLSSLFKKEMVRFFNDLLRIHTCAFIIIAYLPLSYTVFFSEKLRKFSQRI